MTDATTSAVAIATAKPAPQLPVIERLPVGFWMDDGCWAALERLCSRITSSTLIPAEFRQNPSNVFVALMAGLPLGLSPLACVQSIAVINGKPTLYGDAPIAQVLAHESCQDYRDEWEGDIAAGTRKCTFTVVRLFRGKEVTTTRSFSIDDARRAKLWGKEGPWTNYPERMLLNRARTYALRDAFADVLRGVTMAADPFDDEPTVAPRIKVEAVPASPLPAGTVQVSTGIVEDEPAAAEPEKKGRGRKGETKAEPEPEPKQEAAQPESAVQQPEAKEPPADAPAAEQHPAELPTMPTPETKLHLPWSTEPPAVGSVQLSPLGGVMMFDGAEWVEIPDDRGAEAFYEYYCYEMRRMLTRHCQNAKLSRDQAMALVAEKLELPKAPKSMQELRATQLLAVMLELQR